MTCSQEEHLGTSMVAQGLRLHTVNAGAQVQSLLRELRFPHAWGPKPKTKNKNNIVTKFNEDFKMVYIKKKKEHFSWGSRSKWRCLPAAVRWAFWSSQGQDEPTDLPSLTRLGRETLGLGHLPLLVGGLETPHPYVVPLVLGLQTRWLVYHSLSEFSSACFCIIYGFTVVFPGDRQVERGLCYG